MTDLLIMLLLFLVMLFCVAFQAKIHPEGNPGFFDKRNANALRGLWCIIVILVHIPAQYGNALQDMAGSFAYIGVTFYFLASGFGLSLKGLQKGFWRKRLPKLLLPQLLINLCSILLFGVFLGQTPTVMSFLWVAWWLRWLLFCYFLFWLVHKLCKNKAVANGIIGIGIFLFSITNYSLKRAGILTETIWPTEIFGFLWGVLLAAVFSGFQRFGQKKWAAKAAILWGAALILGVVYLKCKSVAFWGDYLLKTALGLGILAFLLFINTKISIGNKALDFLGNISYEMYLSHTVVISLLSRLLPDVSSGVFILLVLSGSLVLSALVWYVSRLLLKNYWRSSSLGSSVSNDTN